MRHWYWLSPADTTRTRLRAECRWEGWIYGLSIMMSSFGCKVMWYPVVGDVVYQGWQQAKTISQKNSELTECACSQSPRTSAGIVLLTWPQVPQCIPKLVPKIQRPAPSRDGVTVSGFTLPPWTTKNQKKYMKQLFIRHGIPGNEWQRSLWNGK